MKLFAFISLFLVECAAFAAGDKLVVHEWGTFTSLQDEAGRALDGINSEDEPLPAFTHDIDHLLVLQKNNLPAFFYQGAPAALPRVTMRLETPVIYFYPPAGSSAPLAVDVKVAFRGGWLTQYYPDAVVEAPGAFKDLTPATVGTLAWRGLKVGVTQSGPQTTEHVWTAPRAVRAASLATTNGECEKFLFYRGVGNVDAPLRVVRDATANQLSVFGQAEGWTGAAKSSEIRRLWLASFRADGSCAYRKLDSVTVRKDSTNALLSTPATFRDRDYRAANLRELRTDMRAALVQDGLFTDEAEALLNTWELSYFKSAGLRLFFLVPRAWTDERLPLEISAPADIERVMVGRIELVTPEQRKLLAELASGPLPQKPWARRETIHGKPTLKGTMPAPYRDLGRFRNALLLDEVKLRLTPTLRLFVAINGIDNYRVEE